MVFSVLKTAERRILIIQLGSGLIGKAISGQLEHNNKVIIKHKVNWAQIQQSTDWLSNISFSKTDYDKVEIIWAAGKAGFAATEAQTNIELNNYTYLVTKLSESTALIPTRFWLMSSAGGLHEGQTCVSPASKLNPSRPYAYLKLEQEKIVQKYFGHCVLCRVSSVYTTHNLNGRLGLIPVLMKNGIQNKISTLVGSESTLRDYILDKDIATYIVRHISAQSTLSGIQYLVNGSPVSIRTIKNYIEQITLKKLYIKYASTKQNAENITFLKSLKAPTFRSTPLLSNIKILYNSLLSYT